MREPAREYRFGKGGAGKKAHGRRGGRAHQYGSHGHDRVPATNLMVGHVRSMRLRWGWASQKSRRTAEFCPQPAYDRRVRRQAAL